MLLNEVRNHAYKRIVQTITYLPHFVSLETVVGLMMDFLGRESVVNQILVTPGIEAISLQHLTLITIEFLIFSQIPSEK